MTETEPLNIELCRVYDCESPAQVLVDVGLVHMDDDGVQDLEVQIIAMCRKHANEEKHAKGDL